ncbi:MAG: major capsid protein [Thermoanaerobaculia bacterium]
MEKKQKPKFDEYQTRLAQGYRAPDLVTLRIAPIVRCTASAGKYLLQGPELWRTYTNLKRAMTADRVRIDMKTSEKGYFLEEYGVESVIYEKFVNSHPVDLRDRVRQQLIDKALYALQLGMAYQVIDFLRNTANYDANNVETFNVATKQWNDTVNSKPYEDLTRIANMIHGRIPGKLSEGVSIGIAPEAFDALMAHPHTFERAKVFAMAPSEDLVARVVGVKAVYKLEDQKLVELDENDPTQTLFGNTWSKDVIAFHEVEAGGDATFADPLSIAIPQLDGMPIVGDGYEEPRKRGCTIHPADTEYGIADVANNRRAYFKDVVA